MASLPVESENAEGRHPKKGISDQKFGSWERSQELDANVVAVGELEGIHFAFDRMERTVHVEQRDPALVHGHLTAATRRQIGHPRHGDELERPIADVVTPVDPPLGFTGPSGIAPRVRPNRDFLPMDDRWRIGFPEWDRYGNGHPLLDDYPFELGHWWDPFNQNVLKGDYPIIGQHTFLNVTASTQILYEPRQVPTATTPFESTLRPFQEEFFGRPNQAAINQFFTLSFDLSTATPRFPARASWPKR